MCAFQETPQRHGESNSTDSAASRSSYGTHPALRQLQQPPLQFKRTPSSGSQSPSLLSGMMGFPSPLRNDSTPTSPEGTPASPDGHIRHPHRHRANHQHHSNNEQSTTSGNTKKHGKRAHNRRAHFDAVRQISGGRPKSARSGYESPTFFPHLDHGSPGGGGGIGRHFLSRDNQSLQNLSVLGRLVDDRTGFHEDKRVSDEELALLGKRKNGSALKEYYEKLNATLDGWREVDEILDSRFPEEVMLRFGSVEEVERLNGMRRRLAQLEAERADSDGTESGYQEESEDSDDDAARKRQSGFARAASALSGLWFGTTPKSRSSSGAAGYGNDEESGLLSSSASGTPARGRRTTRYGSTSGGADFSISRLTAIDDDQDSVDHGRDGSGDTTALLVDDGENKDDATTQQKRSPDEQADNVNGSSKDTPPSASGLERASRTLSHTKAGAVRSTTPSGQNVRSMENGVLASKLESKASTQPAAAPRPRIYRRRSREDSGTESDDEFDTNDDQSDGVAPGALDLKLAAERNDRQARAMDRKAAVQGTDALSQRNSSTSASRERKKTQPGGTSERERMRLLQHVPGRQEREGERERGAQFAININMAVNVLLLAGKVIAVLSSNSVSLIASLVDSALDLLSTLIIFGTSKAISYRSFHTYFKYPVGKKRFEPLGVVIFAALMIASFCQVLVESVERLFAVIRTGSAEGDNADLPLIGVAFMVLTIFIKTFMWIIYRKSHSSGVRAVAQDAQNDVAFNTVSLIFPIVGSKLGWPALDPIGGVCLSIYIITEWLDTLMETVTKLSGSVGSPQDISRALYLILRFRSVNSVGALEVYHAGDDMIVEADIVLPYGMALKEAHDAGEIVCYSMEMLSGIERAYIHLDYNPGGQAGHVTQRG